MKASAEESRQCCDAQLAAAGGNRIVVATRLGQGASDRNLMPPGQVKATFGVMPKQVLADAGYRNEAELARRGASGTWRAWRRTVRRIVDDWRHHCDHERPHSSLGYSMPAERAKQAA